MTVWSNHFESTFQDDDFHVIENNRAIRSVANIPHFFTRPLLYADKPEYAEYRPLAETSFVVDYRIAKGLNPSVYTVDSFVWFLLAVLLFGIFAGFIPGAERRAALFAAALFAFHPVTGESLNYTSRRGDLIGAVALLAGFVMWIVWPGRLPKEIMHWEGVPKTGWDDFRRRWSPRLNAWYRAVVEAPLGLYLVPIVAGLFADPGIAIFPLLLLVYILLFDNAHGARKPWRRVLPSTIICAGFWAAQLSVTWKYGSGFRLHAVPYWIAQPWVVLRYLWMFVFPVHLSAGSDLKAFPGLQTPFAIAGFIGFAGLIALSIRLARLERWRAVSFGLWWLLISLLPTLLVPQRAVESDTRMYVGLLGLALATTRAGWLVYEENAARAPGMVWVRAVGIGTAAVLLLVLCQLTYQRNKVWASQEVFWRDITEKSPGNGRAFLELGSILSANDQPDRGYAAMLHAVSLISKDDAPDQVSLARTFDALNRDIEAREHFQLAIQADQGYAAAWSAFSQWLMVRQHDQEARQAALRALQLAPWNIEAQHTLLDYYSQEGDWENLLKASRTVLSQYPMDADGRRSQIVAQSAFDELTASEHEAESDPSVDRFLALSVQYYKMHRFADAVNACQSALKIQPNLAEAYTNEAAAYFALGKANESIQALREAVRIRPDLSVARHNLEFLLAQQARNPQAATDR